MASHTYEPGNQVLSINTALACVNNINIIYIQLIYSENERGARPTPGKVQDGRHVFV